MQTSNEILIAEHGTQENVIFFFNMLFPASIDCQKREVLILAHKQQILSKKREAIFSSWEKCADISCGTFFNLFSTKGTYNTEGYGLSRTKHHSFNISVSVILSSLFYKGISHYIIWQ